jgi:protein-L-isoaspartate(D-aspartate) O-methyltransferase
VELSENFATLLLMESIHNTFASLTLLIVVIASTPFANAQDPFATERAQMVREVAAMVMETSSYIGKGELNRKVMDAMARVPRHEFVPESRQRYAYDNRPLPIGDGQTISQPYIVALMTDLAGVNENSRVLEIGTGSGYQAAVLAEVVGHVYTIEIIEPLGVRAAQVLKRLKYDNITTLVGDGFHGWAEHAPFDAILVTAAPEDIPAPLLEQLKPGGRLVIPVGSTYGPQSLKVVEKDADGGLHTSDVLPVGFVPLTRD